MVTIYASIFYFCATHIPRTLLYEIMHSPFTVDRIHCDNQNKIINCHEHVIKYATMFFVSHINHTSKVFVLLIRYGYEHLQGHMKRYNGVIMGTIASQITSLPIVYSAVYSDADQRKHQSSASLAFVWWIHRGPVNSPHKWPVTRKMFPFDDVIMDKSCYICFFCVPMLVCKRYKCVHHNNVWNS